MTENEKEANELISLLEKRLNKGVDFDKDADRWETDRDRDYNLRYEFYDDGSRNLK